MNEWRLNGDRERWASIIESQVCGVVLFERCTNNASLFGKLARCKKRIFIYPVAHPIKCIGAPSTFFNLLTFAGQNHAQTTCMKHFYSANDVEDPLALAREGLALKASPWDYKTLGTNKTLGLLFFNSSLRTRMSTQIAAQNLGMNVIVMNVTQDSWQIEMEDGAVMNAGTAEHIKEAAAVLGAYCDVLGIRSFPTLKDREKDYQDEVVNAFMKYSGVPVVSLESATLHPLQSLADVMTIEEIKKKDRPKVVLTWAPHVRALPQAVANSFAQWMGRTGADFTIAHPQGMDLDAQYVQGANVVNDQQEAFKDADVVYVKNWSSFQDYGQVHNDERWIIDQSKLAVTNDAKVMHCLPVRRNVVIADDVLDSSSSVVIQQATNRVYSAQVVLKKILESL